MNRFLLTLLLFVCTLMVRAEIRVDRLTIEGRADQPLGLDVVRPRLGWRILATDGEQNILQTAYHIQIASDSLLLHEGRPDLWDSEAESAQSQYVAYAGKPLKMNQRCFWRVRVEGTAGKARFTTAWSPISSWGVGLLKESNWRGHWIGYDFANDWDREDAHSRLSARYFRTSWPRAKKAIRRATLHIAGLGLYEASINGHRVGQIELAPVPSDYRKSIHYNSFDVTPLLLQPGEAGALGADAPSINSLGVTVSNGRYYTMQQNYKQHKIRNFGYPTLRANLIIEYADGTSERIVTSEKTWEMTCDGPIRSANEYDGEIYDANRRLDSDSLWFAAARSALPGGELLGNLTPPMRVVSTLAPRRTLRRADRILIDFGQNFAGRIRLSGLETLGLLPGDTLRFRWAEKLDGSEGYTLTDSSQLYVANLRHAQSTSLYIANGQDSGSWAPHFCTHAGRFVEISKSTPFATALPDSLILGEVISDEMETIGTFSCSNDLLNRLHEAARWGILSNYKGMPIDCPQRDERMPWLGDRAMGCWGESFIFDNHALYNKWLRDIQEAQRADGCIPDVAPAFWNYYSDNVSWPSVFVFAADMLHTQFGDTHAIEAFYPAMRRWLLHFWQDKRMADGLIHADKYGDWCVTPESPELIHAQDSARITDGRLIASCYFYKLLGEMSSFCDRLLALPASAERSRAGMDEALLRADRAEYEQMRSAVREAVNTQFLTVRPCTSPAPEHLLYPDSIFYANDAVTANLLPLAFGMVPEAWEETIARRIMAKIELLPADGHLCCGVIGIQWILSELTRHGRIDMAYRLASRKTFPSWGYMLENGATTIWELWNGDTANPAMNSGNHVMLLGDLLPWMYRHIGGIRPAEPGYSHIRLEPGFGIEELSSADVEYLTPYGRVVSRWQKTLHRLSWDIEIPANTRAEVVTPNGTRTYGSGRWHIEESLPLGRSADGGIAVRANEFLYEEAEFPSCHAATIVECDNGDLLAAYFGGEYESAPDVCIWTQRKRRLQAGTNGTPHRYEEGWSKPRKVVDGVLSDTLRKACYNPVLFQIPGGDLLLFYKIGQDVRDWTGYLMRSADGGETWTGLRDSIPALAGVEPDSLLGAIKNKPILLPAGFRCANGSMLERDRILSPSSKETATGSKSKAGTWRSHVEYSEDGGRTWAITPPVPQSKAICTIQPSLIVHPDGRIQMLCRTNRPARKHPERARVATSFSDDGGITWSPMQLIDDLPNNNSGIDAVSLPDGSFALIYNPFGCVEWKEDDRPRNKPLRNPLCIATSPDGLQWQQRLTLESSPISQYSYPSMILASDGTLHCIYTWRRERIKYQRLELCKPSRKRR